MGVTGVKKVPGPGVEVKCRLWRRAGQAVALCIFLFVPKVVLSGIVLEMEARTFNPSAGESFRLWVKSGDLDKMAGRIYDPDGGIVSDARVVSKGSDRDWEVVWDGRDGSGKIVPNEAYTFVIESAEGTTYDSASFSGGEVQDIRDATFDDSGTVSYTLPAPSRVLIRLGIRNGPMYRTLVDWKPRPAGKVIEHWDGFDADQLVKLLGHDDFTALVTYVTLPEGTVITYGNDGETYREYKLGRGKDRPQKPERSIDDKAEQRFRPDSLVPPVWARAPRVEMTFPDIQETGAVPTVKRAVNVRIDVAEEDKPHLMEDQFEVLLFVDGQFFAEAERGYLPLNWNWELNQFPPGEHILTVNISSFRGQVGVKSRKILLEP